MSRGTQERQQKRHLIFGYGTITHLGSYFHRIHLTKYFFTLLSTEVETLSPYYPQHHSHNTTIRVVRMKLSLGCFVFARRY